jgi:RND superfamily putative drug exporter
MAVSVLLMALGAVWGSAVIPHLSGSGFDDPNSASFRAAEQIEANLGRQDADVVVLYRLGDRSVSDPAVRQAITGRLAALPADRVAGVQDYWSTGSPGFVADGGHVTYAAVRLTGTTDDARLSAYRAIKDDLSVPGVQASVTGTYAIYADMNSQTSKDIERAELLSFPLVFLLLLVVFGSVVSALLPLVTGLLSILGSLVVIRLVNEVTDVSIFAVNIVSMLGLGLAIDYALFVISRFREELPRAVSVEEAVARTMATAGRTVAFSGITVAVSVAGLTLFPAPFLRTMGYGGVAAVLLAVVGAMTLLPAILGWLGHRVEAGRVRLPGRGSAPGSEGGAWARLAHGVMRRPVAVVVGTLAVLVALGLPFANLHLGGVDARQLPATAEARATWDAMAREFPGATTPPVQVYVHQDRLDRGALAAYTARLGALPDATGARVSAASGSSAVIDVGYHGEVASGTAQRLVGEARAVPAPEGAGVLVGGEPARFDDLVSSINRTLPWTAAVAGGAMLVLLFLAFGSFVLPLKAMLMNVLSLGAAFGAMVWVFQEGHGAGILDFTATGSIAATMPVLILCVAFGLSMDYEVFLLSRIREEWDRTRDNRASVAAGLQRTGRIITSAAVLLGVVVAAFSTSQIMMIKMFGVVMVVALIVDATVVRALLVPATMRLLGRWNWWAPGPVRRWWEAHGRLEPPQAPPGPRGLAAADGPELVRSRG